MNRNFFSWWGFCYEPYNYEMVNSKKDYADSIGNKLIKKNIKLEEESSKQRNKKLRRAILRI